MDVEQDSLISLSSNRQRTGLFRRSVIRSDTRSTLSIKLRVLTSTSVLLAAGIAAL